MVMGMAGISGFLAGLPSPAVRYHVGRHPAGELQNR
jgi:hypothetical protein